MFLTDDGKVPVRWWTHATNFGDLLGPWLVSKITGKEVAMVDRSEPHYMVIGSILQQARPSSVVWGIGSFGVEPLGNICTDATFLAVRGPLTRNKVVTAKGECPRVYGDPALLAPRYWKPDVAVTSEVGLVLRWSENHWQRHCAIPGVKKVYLKSDDIEGTINQICSCRRILSSSLHGLIIADAYGIPNAWLASTTPKGHEFKFWDYFISVNKLRVPVDYNLLQAGLSWERLCEEIEFDERAIEFDPAHLLAASPFN